MRYTRPDPDEPLSDEERIALADLALRGSINIADRPELAYFRLRDRGLILLDSLGRSVLRNWRAVITPDGRAALDE